MYADLRSSRRIFVFGGEEMDEIVRIAIQKKGRLSEKSLAIISGCGIKFGSDERRSVYTQYPPVTAVA